MKHLAAKYVVLGFFDETVRQVVIDNGIHSNLIPHGDVWVLARTNNTWGEPEVLGAQKRFCKKPGENVDQIVLIISNSEVTDTSYELPDQMIHATTSAAACAGFNGSISMHQSNTMAGITVTTDYSLSVAYSPNPTPDSLDPNPPQILTAVAWNFHRVYDQPTRNPPCRTDETAAKGTIYSGGPGMEDSGEFIIGPSGEDYLWSVTLYNDAIVTQISNCNDDHVDVTTTMQMTPAFFTPAGYVDFQDDGHARGTTTNSFGTFTWDLAP